jgi:hypothetical protein
VSQGEGGYAQTESLIRELLTQADPGVTLPARTQVDDTTPDGDVTPETFLSVSKHRNVSGDYREGESTYTLPDDQAPDTVAFGGTWTTDYQGATAGPDAVLNLTFHATVVQAVMGGTGAVTATVRDENGKVVDEVRFDVDGSPRAYPLVSGGSITRGSVQVSAQPGVQAYSFTFG